MVGCNLVGMQPRQQCESLSLLARRSIDGRAKKQTGAFFDVGTLPTLFPVHSFVDVLYRLEQSSTMTANMTHAVGKKNANIDYLG